MFRSPGLTTEAGLAGKQSFYPQIYPIISPKPAPRIWVGLALLGRVSASVSFSEYLYRRLRAESKRFTSLLWQTGKVITGRAMSRNIAVSDRHEAASDKSFRPEE